MKILLIEDDQPIASIIRRGLMSAGFAVDVAADGSEGLRLALQGTYALIVLDLMLPNLDGWALCSALRQPRRGAPPILILSARDSVEDRVRGLELGADDYLPKPFHFPELLARVRSLVRRHTRPETEPIRIADLEIDLDAGRVRRGGGEVPLTPGEYSLLELLVAHAGTFLSARALSEARSQTSDTEPGGTVERELEQLRQKIDGEREPKLLFAVEGLGYVLRAPEAVRAAVA